MIVAIEREIIEQPGAHQGLIELLALSEQYAQRVEDELARTGPGSDKHKELVLKVNVAHEVKRLLKKSVEHSESS